MEFVLLTKGLPDKEPKIRLYDNYVSFNAAAVEMMGLKNDDYVQFAHPAYDAKTETYVRKTGKAFGSYIGKKHKCAIRVSSRKLAAILAERLDGVGCYRVCPEGAVHDEDGTWYNIFFKNYDKKDTD